MSVCVDVFMTETARHSDYVLPAATQYEKFEATFFNFNFPKNLFHLRRPVLDPPQGPLPEPEVHARIVEALGLLDPTVVEALSAPTDESANSPRRSPRRPPPIRGSPPSLPSCCTAPSARRSRTGAAAASLWPMVIRCSQINPDGVARAGFGSDPMPATDCLDAIVDSPSGVVFTDDTWEATWQRIKTTDGLVHVEIPELLVELVELARERRRATTRSGHCFCLPGNGARSRRTRSCVTRRGGRRMSRVRCVSRPLTLSGSASPTAAPPRSPRSDRPRS